MMSVTDILEQAKKLTSDELDILLNELQTLQKKSDSNETVNEHWGKSLNTLSNEIGVIEMKYPEIDDPVKWVKQLREESRNRRFEQLDNEE